MANSPQWLTYSPVANTAATFFSTSSSTINWLSTAFLFAFVVASPATLYALRSGGPRLAFTTSSILMLVGTWFRYAGTRCSPPSFPLVMTGQILIGLAQPFVLAAPTHYSNLWFSPRGRVSATAVASLANPFGGALGQLISPLLATSPSAIPKMTLYVAVITTVIAIPSFFIPIRPPTPSSPASHQVRPSLRESMSLLLKNTNFLLLMIPFTSYVALFNSATSILTQVLTPYGYSEEESGIAGALLIVVGLVAAAISSPLIDRTKAYLLCVRIFVPIIAICYLAFIWAPPTRALAAPYVILSILGAASFSLVPVALEMLVEVTFPVGPEVGSIIAWTAGQLFGGVFIVASDASQSGPNADPPGNMHRALVFQAAMAWSAVPAAMTLGWVAGGITLGRNEMDTDAGREVTDSRREVTDLRREVTDSGRDVAARSDDDGANRSNERYEDAGG